MVQEIRRNREASYATAACDEAHFIVLNGDLIYCVPILWKQYESAL